MGWRQGPRGSLEAERSQSGWHHRCLCLRRRDIITDYRSGKHPGVTSRFSTESSRLERRRWGYLTSSGRQHVDELLGISDVERCYRHETVGLPHFDLVGEADEVKVVAGSQIPQDGKQSIFSLRVCDRGMTDRCEKASPNCFLGHFERVHVRR